QQFVKAGNISEIVDMKPFLIALFFLIPCLCFGQKKMSDYDIYSEYFRIFQHQKGSDFNFIVRVKPEYNSKTDDPGLSSILDDFRDYTKNGRLTGGPFILYCPQLIDTLKKDTLWLPLVEQLNGSLKKPRTIRNAFAKD